MKILVLTPHYPPARGGTSDYTARLCKQLTEEGHSVTVIARNGGDEGSPVFVENFSGVWSLRSRAWFAQRAGRTSPDLLLVQYGPYAFNRRGPGIPVALLISWLSRRFDIPVLVYGHELYAPWRQSWLRTPWHVSQRLALAMLIAVSKTFVVTIEVRRARLARLFPWWSDKITAIPVTPTLDKELTESHWRESHSISPGTFLVAAMGVDDPTKGAHVLGLVADALRGAGVPTRIVTIGGLQPDHEGVESWGYVSAHDAWNLLGAADLFVMPYADGVSARRTSVLNALAAGAAVLTTEGVNTDPSLFGSGAVALVSAQNDEALAREAVMLAKDSERRESLRREALDLSAAEFSWSAHLSRWDELFEHARRK